MLDTGIFSSHLFFSTLQQGALTNFSLHVVLFVPSCAWWLIRSSRRRMRKISKRGKRGRERRESERETRGHGCAA